MLELSTKWAKQLVFLPETGMGYQIATVILKDGRRFDQVVIVGGAITQIRGHQSVPFAEEDIGDIVVTHDNWDFKDAKSDAPTS